MRVATVFLLVFIFLFSGCTSGEDRLINWMQKENITMTDLTTKTYSDTEIKEIVKFEGSLKELNAIYEIEYIRDNNGIGYKVYYWGESLVGFIGYDYSGKKPSGAAYHRAKEKSEFDALVIGVDGLNRVQEIDQEGNFPFLYVSSKVPHASTHFTEDGYDICITYDDSNVITDIRFESIRQGTVLDNRTGDGSSVLKK